MNKKLDSILNVVKEEVSRETLEKLQNLESFFLKWAKHINLVAPSTLDDVWSRHILDSAQLWAYRGDAKNWIDLGSGSGFPALVISCLLGDQGKVTMVESNVKKASYLRNASASLGLNTLVRTERVEALGTVEADLITARAFAPLPRLFEFSESIFANGRRALLHKGRGYQQELEDVRDEWDYDLLIHQSLVDSDSVILEISNLRRR